MATGLHGVIVGSWREGRLYGRFVAGHFGYRSFRFHGFSPGSFRSRVVSVPGHFGLGSFRSQVVSIPGVFGRESFRIRSFLSRVISVPGSFGHGSFRSQVVSSPGRFGPVSFQSRVMALYVFPTYLPT